MSSKEIEYNYWTTMIFQPRYLLYVSETRTCSELSSKDVLKSQDSRQCVLELKIYQDKNM